MAGCTANNLGGEKENNSSSIGHQWTTPALHVVILGDGAPEKKAYHAMMTNYRGYLQH